MPLIGAGLDQLDWDITLEFIKELFNGDDIEILICRYKPNGFSNDFPNGF